MLQVKFRTAALASSAVLVLALAGCSAREPADAPHYSAEPPAAADEAGRPDLLGASPDAPPSDGLLGGPIAQPKPVAVTQDDSRLKTWRRADGTLVTAMAPIANPGEGRASARPRPAPPVRQAGAAPARVAPAASRPAAAKPVAAKPAPVAAAAPAPKTVAQAPALKPVAPPAKPAAPLAKAPSPVISAQPAPAQTTAAAAAAAAKLPPKIEKLQAAVAPAATSGAVLAAAESLKSGKAGQVTLSLPASLGDMIRDQAAKLGLGKPAKSVSAYAELEGQGYDVTPAGRQTAQVKPGEPTTFAWQVQPTAQAQGSLTTRFGASLDGVKPAQAFSLGAITKQVAAAKAKAQTTAKDLGLSALLDKTFDLPGFGKVPGKSLLGAGLVLLAVIILVAISRNASKARARAERRRKFRTHTDYGRNEPEFDTPAAADVAYVNPLVAAAGGAIVGAAGAAMFNKHQDAKAEDAAEHEPFPAPADDSPQVQHVSAPAEETRREPEPAH